jgi:hypothetical protein
MMLELDTSYISQVILIDLDTAGIGGMMCNADPGVVLIGWWVLAQFSHIFLFFKTISRPKSVPPFG